MRLDTPADTAATKGVWQMAASTLGLGLWLLACGMTVSLLVLRWWPGDRLLVVRMLNYAMPWCLALLLPALALALVMGRQWLALTLALPTAFILFTFLPLFLPGSSPPEAGQPTLKVMSYNVWSRNQDLAAVAGIVLAEKPDLLLMQELTPARVPELRALLESQFPFDEAHFAYNRNGLLATFSRTPLKPLREGDSRAVQKLQVEIAGAPPITVYNVHFLRTILRRRSTWQQLHNQVEALLVDEIAATPDRVLMGGDFNLTDQTQTYRLISAYLRNAHWDAGFGFGFTYPSPARKLRGSITLPAMVRIDHLFYGKALTPLQAGTLPQAGGSDHLPIFAEFRLRQQG